MLASLFVYGSCHIDIFNSVLLAIEIVVTLFGIPVILQTICDNLNGIVQWVGQPVQCYCLIALQKQFSNDLLNPNTKTHNRAVQTHVLYRCGGSTGKETLTKLLTLQWYIMLANCTHQQDTPLEKKSAA